MRRSHQQSGPPHHQSPRKPGTDEGETPLRPPPPQIFNFCATFGGECPTSDCRTDFANSDCTTTAQSSSSEEEDSDVITPVGSRPLRKRSSVNYDVAKLIMDGMGELDTPSQKKAELAFITNGKGLSQSEEAEYSPGESGPPPREPPAGGRKKSRMVRSPWHDADKPPPISASRQSVEQRMGGKQPTIDRYFSPWLRN